MIDINLDDAFNTYSNFRGYVGDQPKNESQYVELLNDSSRYINGNPVFEGTAPTWSEVQSKLAELIQAEQAKIDAKSSALAKLSSLGLTEEEIQSIIK